MLFRSGSTTHWGGEATTQPWPSVGRKTGKVITNPNQLSDAFLIELDDDVGAIQSGIILRPLSQAIDDYSVVRSYFALLEARSVISMEGLIPQHKYKNISVLRPEESDDDNDESYQSDEYFLNLHCHKVSDTYDPAES